MFIFSVFSNINGEHESTLTTSKKYPWCILVQKEIKPTIWGAAITPEPWNRQKKLFSRIPTLESRGSYETSRQIEIFVSVDIDDCIKGWIHWLMKWQASQLFTQPFVQYHRKHQSWASLAFVRGNPWWPVDSPHKGLVMWTIFIFDDVIMFHKLSIGFHQKTAGVYNNVTATLIIKSNMYGDRYT